MAGHARDDVLRRGRDVNLRRGQVHVTQNPLHVGDRHLRVACHPVGSGMTQVVQRPVRSQRLTRPAEHRAGRVIRQRPERAPQRPPHRVVRPGRHLAVRLLLVDPQPDERVRRRRQRLHRPRPLADHRHQLAAGIHAPAGGAEQLRSPRARGHPERDQGPVPVRRQRREQLVEHPVRDAPRDALRLPGPEQPGPLLPERLQRVMVRIRPASLPGQRERVGQRPGPGLQVIVVKRPAYRLAVRDRRGRVSRARRRLPGHRVHRPRRRPGTGPCRTPRPPVIPLRLARQLQPPAEVPGLRPRRLVPLEPGRPREPEPPQQVQRV